MDIVGRMYKHMITRIYNETLNPELWDLESNMLKPEVRERLLQIAQEFYSETDLKAPIEDIYILGSAANYNWNDVSDIDLHVVVEMKLINPDVELAKQLADQLKINWNQSHNITIKNHRVEVYIQDVNHSTRALAIYSILNNKWIRVPQKLNLNLDKESIQRKYTDMVKQINNAIKSQSLDNLKRVLKALYDMRESGLSKGGEFSTENIVFKLLRSRYHVDKLKKAVNTVYDNQRSIKES